MKTYQIYLLRHGITDGNLCGQYIGSTDLSLCEQGKAELLRLDNTRRYPGAAAFISSPMKRCMESMSIIYPQANVLPIDGLRECDFGEFEGKTAEELSHSEAFAEWLAGKPMSAPFGGEPLEHFSERVCETFEAIVSGLMKTGTTTCVIMTHGGIISLLLSKYGLPKAEPTDWPCEPGCGYAVRIHPQLWMSGQVFEVYDRLPFAKDDEE